MTPQVKRMGKRGSGSVRKVEQEPARREDLDDATANDTGIANVTGGAGQERTSKSLNLAPSSSSSTPPSSASSSVLRSLSPAAPAPALSSDRSVARRESGRRLQAGHLAEPCRQGPSVGQGEQLQPGAVSDSAEVNVDLSRAAGILDASGWVARGALPRRSGRGGHSGAGVPPAPADPQEGLGENGAELGSSSHASMTKAIQQDTALWEQLHDCNIYRYSPRSLMERQAIKSRAAEVWQRGVSGPPIRRVQIASSLAASDPTKLYGSQLERFLSLLVQADSRLVGSSMGHRIQLVDCRMMVEGQELDSLTEAVYKRLTTILCQRDPWEDILQSLEAFVEEKGRLPLRRAQDEKRLAYWLTTQQGRLRAGLLLVHRWRRLVNSSSRLILQRVGGWLLHDLDGKFKRRCLDLKAYIEMKGKLPRHTKRNPNSQSHRLAVWLRSVANRGGWSKPDRRAMLESLHPLVAELVAKWSATTIRINLPTWQRKLHRLVNCVQAKGHLPRSVSSDEGLYEWLRQNLQRLERLPRELVKQLHDSHPLIAAKVRAAQAKHVEKGPSQKGAVRGMKSVGLPRMLWGEVSMVAPSW